MTIGIIILGIVIAIFIFLIIIGIKIEKENFNKGYCKICHQKLRRFYTNSQGGRGYTCPEMHYPVCVSYSCVDKDFEED